jgi:hypothetical protein
MKVLLCAQCPFSLEMTRIGHSRNFMTYVEGQAEIVAVKITQFETFSLQFMK